MERCQPTRPTSSANPKQGKHEEAIPKLTDGNMMKTKEREKKLKTTQRKKEHYTQGKMIRIKNNEV